MLRQVTDGIAKCRFLGLHDFAKHRYDVFDAAASFDLLVLYLLMQGCSILFKQLMRRLGNTKRLVLRTGLYCTGYDVRDVETEWKQL